MKLIHNDWNFSIEFKENKIQQLIIESPAVIKQWLWNLHIQQTGGTGGFVLSQDNKELDIKSKSEMIIDPFSIGSNSNKVLKCLYKEIHEIAFDEYNYPQTQSILGAMYGLVENFALESQHSLTYDMEPDFGLLLKAYALRLDDESEELIEKISNYTEAMTKFLNVELFIFYNLKTVLSYAEMEQLYMQWIYDKTNILMIESEQRYDLQFEENHIIDTDLCFI